MCTRPFFSRDRGETETKAFRARDRDEAEAYQLRGEIEPRHYCASRLPRDRGVKATSHIHIIPRTDVVLKRSGGSLELRLNRSDIFKHNFIYVMLKCLPTRPRRLLPRPRPRPRPSVSRPRLRPRRSVSRPMRDRRVWNFNRGETEPRHYCASRPRRQERGHVPVNCPFQDPGPVWCCKECIPFRWHLDVAVDFSKFVDFIYLLIYKCTAKDTTVANTLTLLRARLDQARSQYLKAT